MTYDCRNSLVEENHQEKLNPGLLVGDQWSLHSNLFPHHKSPAIALSSNFKSVFSSLSHYNIRFHLVFPFENTLNENFLPFCFKNVLKYSLAGDFCLQFGRDFLCCYVYLKCPGFAFLSFICLRWKTIIDYKEDFNRNS